MRRLPPLEDLLGLVAGDGIVVVVTVVEADEMRFE